MPAIVAFPCACPSSAAAPVPHKGTRRPRLRPIRAPHPQSNPPDLVGSWALENGGWEGLSDLPVQGSEVEDVGLSDLVVAFRKDGTVQVPPEAGVGLEWRLEPGPTHLDTVYFDMIPADGKVRGNGRGQGGGVAG